METLEDLIKEIEILKEKVKASDALRVEIEKLKAEREDEASSVNATEAAIMMLL